MHESETHQNCVVIIGFYGEDTVDIHALLLGEKING
jgi:hypothetical protein